MTKSTAQVETTSPEMPAGRGEATREQILAATASLIAELGWGAVTTRAIAERAGVNAALVHYHFGSIDSLLRTAALGRVEPELEAAIEPFAAPGPLDEAIARGLARLERFDSGTETGVLLAELLLRATRDQALNEAMADELTAFRLRLEERLRLAADDGEIRKDVEPEMLAVLIAAVLDGLLLQRMADPQVDLAVVADGLTRLLAPRSEDGR